MENFMLNLNTLIEYKDMFNISNRIKKIDKGYRLFYDNFNKLFIILNIAKNNDICLKFNAFNLNIEQILLKTQIKNFKTLSAEIEKHNSMLETNSLRICKQNFNDKANDLVNYSARTNKILQSDINKILGVKND